VRRTNFEVDHVVPEKMNGETANENLALACFKCNNHKGPNIAGIDPETGEKAYLYDPRADPWTEHFRWDGPFFSARRTKAERRSNFFTSMTAIAWRIADS
jgi:HNH endonuclease